jgi:hypothetical protein
VEGNSARPVKSLSLEYETSQRTSASTLTRVEPTFAVDRAINTSYTWEMKKSGGALPPGTRITWRWRVTDDAGRSWLSERKDMSFDDTRYTWQMKTRSLLDLYCRPEDAALVDRLATNLEEKLARGRLGVETPTGNRIKTFVYPDTESMKAAMLYPQDWMGAVAFPTYNTILIPVNASLLTWAQGALAHEVTHLLIREAIFGPFDDIPVWLNEGLAEYVEGDLTTADKSLISNALRNGQLISVKSLGSPFPADPQQALLCYAESHSLVDYLINQYGWDKMRALLAVFKDGATYDGALKKVYGVDIAGLDKQWRVSLTS